ncbi:MAG: hypothetical protein L3K00_04740 [Thermoplasmata archaeon]|nr:hypothetical protein [Thermoplasmata archaeon]
MPPRFGSRFSEPALPRLAALAGVALGVAMVVSTVIALGPGSRPYWQTTVSVPADANAMQPDEVSFHGATFTIWWPPALPAHSISTGLQGVEIQIAEPSGAVDNTSTGCGACGSGVQSWYSSDGGVGVSYTDGSFELVTLLVAV